MIAVYGLKFVLAGVILTAACALGAAWRDSLWFFILALVLAVLTVFLTYFYRNPVRTIPTDSDLILSVADGKVVAVEHGEIEELDGPGYKISIFLSVFNVHINRIPCAGRVEEARYTAGSFLPAFEDEASVKNEQAEIRLKTEKGIIVFRQIAGILARRIENDFLNEDITRPHEVSAGEIYGMIHFGSRADLLIPDNTEIIVKVGDRVKGGETPIAKFK